MPNTSNDFGLPFAVYQTVTYSAGTGFSTTIKTGVGKLAGIMLSVASGTPTLAVYDGTSASGTTIIPTFTPVAGTSYWFGANVLFTNGLHIYSGGSVVASIIYF